MVGVGAAVEEKAAYQLLVNRIRIAAQSGHVGLKTRAIRIFSYKKGENPEHEKI